jgi:glycerol-1-phosphate dehydrogenase [NAD(P)+]
MDDALEVNADAPHVDTDAPYVNPLTRPTRDALVVGPGVLADALAGVREPFMLVSQPGPLANVPDALIDRAARVIEAVSLDHGALERLSLEADGARAIVGIGGGVVMDSAKWLAYRSGAALLLAPSILSADACVTNSIAVREAGRVVYRGFVEAEQIVVDVELIRSAPPRLNRAGVGDLLSIHTALWDWWAGERAGRATVDRAVARRAAEVLDTLEEVAGGVQDVTEESLRAIITGYAEINDMTMACGHAQMEEGSEHYLGYLLEQRTGRSFVHGELVTLGVLVISALQGNDPSRARSIADRAGVSWRPGALELSRETLAEALRDLHSYVEASGFAYSVANERPLDQGTVDALLDEVM